MHLKTSIQWRNFCLGINALKGLSAMLKTVVTSSVHGPLFHQWSGPAFQDDVIKWKHFSTLLSLCAGNSPVTGEFPSQSPVTALMFSLICAWINCWVNNRDAGDLRCHGAHYDVTVILSDVQNKVWASEIRHYNVFSHWLKTGSAIVKKTDPNISKLLFHSVDEDERYLAHVVFLFNKT